METVQDGVVRIAWDDRQLMIPRHIEVDEQVLVEETCERSDLVGRTVQRDPFRMIELGLVNEITQNKIDPTKIQSLPWSRVDDLL